MSDFQKMPISISILKTKERSRKTKINQELLLNTYIFEGKDGAFKVVCDSGVRGGCILGTLLLHPP